MSYIVRSRYMEKIRQFIDKPIIKVLSGMRRVGKSTILLLIKDEVFSHIPDKNKIYLNFESIELFTVNKAEVLIEYLKPLIKDLTGRIYFFFDEIQFVENWEQVINGLRLAFRRSFKSTGRKICGI